MALTKKVEWLEREKKFHPWPKFMKMSIGICVSGLLQTTQRHNVESVREKSERCNEKERDVAPNSFYILIPNRQIPFVFYMS